MPFESKAQRGFMFAEHPEIAKRWAKETPKGAQLPEHVHQEGKKHMDPSITHDALRAVVKDMAEHARRAKAKRYQPHKGVDVTMGEVTLEPKDGDHVVAPDAEKQMDPQDLDDLMRDLEVQR